jgi:hypothetical protein
MQINVEGEGGCCLFIFILDRPLCNYTHDSANPYDLCTHSVTLVLTGAQTYSCKRLHDENKLSTKHFAIEPGRQTAAISLVSDAMIAASASLISTSSYQRCHRGMPLVVWINREKNLTRETCLCPPN